MVVTIEQFDAISNDLRSSTLTSEAYASPAVLNFNLSDIVYMLYHVYSGLVQSTYEMSRVTIAPATPSSSMETGIFWCLWCIGPALETFVAALSSLAKPSRLLGKPSNLHCLLETGI